MNLGGMPTRDPLIRFKEWATWYEHHKNQLSPDNLSKRCDFLTMAFDGLMEVMAITIMEAQDKKQASENLWIPVGMTLEGDIKKFG
jgi:hypothetical protein